MNQPISRLARPGSRPVQTGSPSPATPPGRNGKSLKPGEMARLRQAAHEFEAIFLEQVLKTARQSPPKAGLFASGAGRDIYQGMADQQLARAVSKGGGGLGLGKLLLRSLAPGQQTKPSSPGPTRPIP